MSNAIAPPPEIVLSATAWKSNSDLIVAARDLGYLNGRVLDPTYGKGNWWKTWRPDRLTIHDICADGVDFRCLPEHAGSFDAVAFDPPYIPQGGRATSTVQSFLGAYGLLDVPSTNEALRALIRDGMIEFRRILTVGGTVVVKCMSYVNAGRWRPMPRWIADDAETMGYVQIDELVHLRTPGPQPPRDRQLTSRRNYSMLLVFRWPGGETGPQLDFGGMT